MHLVSYMTKLWQRHKTAKSWSRAQGPSACLECMSRKITVLGLTDTCSYQCYKETHFNARLAIRSWQSHLSTKSRTKARCHCACLKSMSRTITTQGQGHYLGRRHWVIMCAWSIYWGQLVFKVWHSQLSHLQNMNFNARRNVNCWHMDRQKFELLRGILLQVSVTKRGDNWKIKSQRVVILVLALSLVVFYIFYNPNKYYQNVQNGY